MEKPMKDLIEILNSCGPLTGKELLLKAGSNHFSLWAACNRSDQIITRIIGKRYLRLDRQVEEYARLSPSIMREFYGYTVVGTERYAQEIEEKAAALQQQITAISQQKLELAQSIVKNVVETHPDASLIKHCACFMIAGDVVYEMAHAEPRPESSTGELVKGSDLDIIVVYKDLPETATNSLDAAIYNEKYKLLMNPAGREEIDYIIKDISKVHQQLKFKGFKSMVAAKILDEANFLYGSEALFKRLKSMLAEKGIPQILDSLSKKALLNREQAQAYLLLKAKEGASEEEFMKLFYTAEEKEEIF
jgi:hypothetical protein